MDALLDTPTSGETAIWESLSIPRLPDSPASGMATKGNGDELRNTTDRRSEARADEPSDDGAGETVTATTPPKKLCLAFQGACGGVGTTTLAIETAHIMARSRRGSVCLVDLDFETGALAHYLDATTQPQGDDLMGDPARLDAQYLKARLHAHEAGFSVFAPAPNIDGDMVTDPACVLAALDTLADMFDVLVVDVPRLGRPWTRAALLAADRVCVVTDLSIPALHLTRQRLEAMETIGVETADVILSKYERRSFRASLRINDAERALGRKVLGVVAADAHSATDALNCAVPVSVAARDSRIAKDIGAIARDLSPHYAERRSGPRRRRNTRAR